MSNNLLFDALLPEFDKKRLETKEFIYFLQIFSGINFNFFKLYKYND